MRKWAGIFIGGFFGMYKFNIRVILNGLRYKENKLRGEYILYMDNIEKLYGKNQRVLI